MYETVTQESIAEMVDTFYGRVREDQLLGPIFIDAIGADWNPHLQKMKAFWSSVLLGSRTYKGNPMMAHLRLPRLLPGHFERWLELWRDTAAGLCCEPLASLFVQRAETIGQHLLYAISSYHETLNREPVETAP